MTTYLSNSDAVALNLSYCREVSVTLATCRLSELKRVQHCILLVGCYRSRIVQRRIQSVRCRSEIRRNIHSDRQEPHNLPVLCVEAHRCGRLRTRFQSRSEALTWRGVYRLQHLPAMANIHVFSLVRTFLLSLVEWPQYRYRE